MEKRSTRNTARATNCSSLMVSWCHSFRWYRSAKAPYQSASSGCAFCWDSRYCSAPAIDGSVDLFRREKSMRPRKKSRSPNSTLIASLFFSAFFSGFIFQPSEMPRTGEENEGGVVSLEIRDRSWFIAIATIPDKSGPLMGLAVRVQWKVRLIIAVGEPTHHNSFSEKRTDTYVETLQWDPLLCLLNWDVWPYSCRIRDHHPRHLAIALTTSDSSYTPKPISVISLTCTSARYYYYYYYP